MQNNTIQYNAMQYNSAAIEWSVTQLFAMAVKQSLCLRAPIQNRGGFLFALWNSAAVTIECSNHRSILCANTDG